MPHKVIVWRPTPICKCELEIMYDDEPLATRKFELFRMISKCTDHANLSDFDCFNKLREECEIWNRVWFASLQVKPAQERKRRKEFTWQFDASRVLRVHISGFDEEQMENLQTAADSYFGEGKVVVE